MKDVEKSRTSFISVNLRVLREKHLFQCPPHESSSFSLFAVLLPDEICRDPWLAERLLGVSACELLKHVGHIVG